MADGFDRQAAGRHTRRAERPGLRRVSVVALVMLVLQYGLGTILNFYVEVPPADAHAGIVTEIATAPLALTAHALLGVILIGTAILLVTRAITMRERLLAVLAAAGLLAIGGAFLAGETFVKNGQDSTSFAMAMLTGAALLCYIAILTLTSGTRPRAGAGNAAAACLGPRGPAPGPDGLPGRLGGRARLGRRSGLGRAPAPGRGSRLAGSSRLGPAPGHGRLVHPGVRPAAPFQADGFGCAARRLTLGLSLPLSPDAWSSDAWSSGWGAACCVAGRTGAAISRALST